MLLTNQNREAMSKEIKPDGWVARDYDGSLNSFSMKPIISQRLKEWIFDKKDCATFPLKAYWIKLASGHPCGIPISFIPTAELEAMQEVVEALKIIVEKTATIRGDFGEYIYTKELTNEMMINARQALAKLDNLNEPAKD
jgi:hypothetical protein